MPQPPPPQGPATRTMATIMQLRKACNHPFLLEEDVYAGLDRDEAGGLAEQGADLLVRCAVCRWLSRRIVY